MQDMPPRVSAILPAAFCWTRFGPEAGEGIEEIIERKERERCANDGIFFWGIGNSVAPAMRELIAQVDAPEVLFSPIKSRPRRVDVAPESVVRWRAGETLSGRRFRLPRGARITSRWRGSSTLHYALVCRAESQLRFCELGWLSPGSLRNLLRGTSIGASQVTAVVRREDAEDSENGARYAVALRAQLVEPYFIRLHEPALLT